MCARVGVFSHIFHREMYAHTFTYICPKIHTHSLFWKTIWSLILCTYTAYVCTNVCISIERESDRKPFASIFNLFHIRINVFYTTMNKPIHFAQIWYRKKNLQRGKVSNMGEMLR